MTRLISTLCLIAMALLAGLAALPARAQGTNCAPLVDALAWLTANYQETSRVSALMANGELLILTASEAGTWTGLAVTPDLMACVVAYGQGFEAIAPPVPGDTL